jgi:DNA-binding response OmpR family regulator
MIFSEARLMKRRSILVVEDDIVLCTAMESALVQRGYDTRIAHSVSHSIELTRERLPELLILDISLPDGLGWSVLDYIAVTFPDSEVASVVATSDRVTRSQLRAYQVQKYIAKPFDLSHLMEAVVELLPLDDHCRQEPEPAR